MIVTCKIVASKIGEWLGHEITFDQLVDWSKYALQEATFDASAAGEIAEVVARLGLADGRAFGLTWDDCEKLLQRLGYEAHVEILNA